MTKLANHLAVYKLLPKTNCRQCDAATCLAFAVAVMQGNKRLSDCPFLQDYDSVEIKDIRREGPSLEDDTRRALGELQGRVRKTDLAAAAERVGGAYGQGKLTIKCLGKDFHVDQDGVITSGCHVNMWVSAPILQYVLGSAGRKPVGQWVPLRETKGGADWRRLFGQRCEKPLKKVIDDYTGLMEDLVHIFAGKPAPASFDSDIAVVIHPLPKLPMLLCYWKKDEGMDSSLHMFFDVTAEDNLNVESIYTLSVGLVTMFQKIALTHGK